MRELSLSDRLLRDAATIVDLDSVLEAERWASGWLGAAWSAAGIGEREPEHLLRLEVVGRACSRPSPQGLAAVAALRRVAPDTATSMLDGTIEILAESQPMPAWFDTRPFEPVRAWRAVDVWDSEHVLFVEYAGPVPHTLMAQIMLAGGVLVETLALLQPDAAASWEPVRDASGVPMPIAEHPVPDALAELADAMRITDMTVPRQDDEDFVDLRALAWSRCRAYLPDWSDRQPLGVEDRDRLLDDFVAASTDPVDGTVVRSLAEVFLDYGEGYMSSGPLCWSPVWVELFMTDWLPRKAVLDAEQRTALPQVLRHWLRFALRRRGVDPDWITPVTDAVDRNLPEFVDAFDNTAVWGPAKQIAAELAARGVDLTDEDAVDDGVRALNAERLARYLTGE